MRFFVIMCCNVFNVRPETALLLPVWSRDAKSLDIPGRLYSQYSKWEKCSELGDAIPRFPFRNKILAFVPFSVLRAQPTDSAQLSHLSWRWPHLKTMPVPEVILPFWGRPQTIATLDEGPKGESLASIQDYLGNPICSDR